MHVNHQIRLRPAESCDAEALTNLSMRSKAHWGYDQAFLDACRDELTVTPEKISKTLTLVAQIGGRIVGFAGLTLGRDAESAFEVIFIEPDMIGAGIGGVLMTALIRYAKEEGLKRIFVDSDPNARGYYEHFGFKFLEDTPSGSIPGRRIPRLVLKI